MRLIQRVLLAPAAAIVSMLMLGAMGYWALNAQHHANKNIYEDGFVDSAVVNKVRTGVVQAHGRTYRLLTWSDRQAADLTDRETRALLADFDRATGEFSNWASRLGKDNAEETDLARQMTAQMAKYRAAIVAALDLASADMNAGVMAMQTADDRYKVLSEVADKIVAFQERAGGEDLKHAKALYSRVMFLATATLLLAVATAAIIATVVSRGISRRIGGEPEYATQVVRAIAEGNLSVPVRIDERNHDSLLAGMKTMQDSLRDVVGQIQMASSQLVDSAQGLTAVSQEVAANNQAQGDATSAVAASIEEMSSSIANVADSAIHAQTRAAASGTQASQSAGLVQKTIAGIHTIAGSVERSSQVVQSLGEESNRISGIIQTIKEIADQTNLLALNAAIEAARAGEQGRGFAVVADEVRKLAEKTSHSTQEISSMIASIQNGTRDAVKGMESGADQVREGISVAGEAGEAMGLAESEARNVSQSIDEISVALKEQRSAAEQITQHIERIAIMTQENSDEVGRLTVSATGLQTVAQNLKNSVNRFHL